MNPWAHIDELKEKLAQEKAAAVARLKEAGFTGDVAGRLTFNGQDWEFPVRGQKMKSRTLDRLVALAQPFAPRKAS